MFVRVCHPCFPSLPLVCIGVAGFRAAAASSCTVTGLSATALGSCTTPSTLVCVLPLEIGDLLPESVDYCRIWI